MGKFFKQVVVHDFCTEVQGNGNLIDEDHIEKLKANARDLKEIVMRVAHNKKISPSEALAQVRPCYQKIFGKTMEDMIENEAHLF